MINAMKRLIVLLLATALSLPLGAFDLPDLGAVSASALSEREERELGQEIMREIRTRDAAYIDDEAVSEYLAALAGRLLQHSTEPGRPLQLFALAHPSINAFALPGGHIGIHAGLVRAAESESELAAVIAHEIAHVTQRHLAQMIEQHNAVSPLLIASLLLGMIAARDNPELAQAAVATGQAGAMASQLSYSRAFERDADRAGLGMLVDAGFDPRAMPSFFVRLQRANRLAEQGAPDYLRTHPLTEQRIADVEGRVAGMRYRQIVGSVEFALVRARLQVALLGPDALSAAERVLESAPDDPVSRYAALVAALASRQAVASARHAQALEQAGLSSFLVEQALAENARLQGRPDEAVARLSAARAREPERRSTAHALAEALIEAGDIDDAVMLTRALTPPGAPRASWQWRARAESAAGNRAAMHRAQAEVYAYDEAWLAAIEQLELARRDEATDFFERSTIDVRLNELKQKQRESRP